MQKVTSSTESNFHTNFKTYGYLENIPNLKDNGFISTTEPFENEAKEFSKKLKFDEYQAVLTRPLNECWQDDVWEYKKALYSYITTLRNHNKAVEVITANILPTTTIDGSRYILLQKRSKSSGLYPGYYSIFGGSFSPKDDKEDLYMTALRELKEEISGITSSDTDILQELQKTNYLLTQETDNGNLQINFYPVEIALSQDATGAIDEGDMLKIPFNEIENFVSQNIDTLTPLALAIIGEL